MPTYIVLFKLTDQGVKDIKDTPGNVKEGAKMIEALGGKLKDFYAVMGEYDFVAIAEFPSDEAQMNSILTVASQGGIRATTMKAFSMKEFTEIINKLP